MRIRELVEKLNFIKSLHGDLNIEIYNYKEDIGYILSGVKVTQDYGGLEKYLELSNGN